MSLPPLLRKTKIHTINPDTSDLERPLLHPLNLEPELLQNPQACFIPRIDICGDGFELPLIEQIWNDGAQSLFRESLMPRRAVEQETNLVARPDSDLADGFDFRLQTDYEVGHAVVGRADHVG